jgi:hypothetical protein
MKLTFSALFGLSLLLSVFFATSCNRYIDKATTERKVQVMQGNITFYPDSNILVYKSNVGLRMDNEVLKPKSFYAKLPKGLKWYAIGSDVFKFYYPNKQAVAVNINQSDNAPIHDTTYVPTEAELSRFIDLSNPSSSDKYDLSKIDYKPNRKHLIMKKGAATILLYNITPKNYSKFTEYLKEFKFLNDPAE